MSYPGGKGKCFQQLINLMPPHHTYIEGYLGAGAVIKNKKPSQRTIGIDIDPTVLASWTGCTDNIELIEADAVSYLESFEFSNRELVYLDPPYLPSTRRKSRVYKYDYNEEQHERLLNMATNLPCLVMISGYANEMYHTHLSTWNQVKFMANSHVGLREESVWFNFEPPSILHDTSYLGSNFRERQTIKRRRERLYERIEGMDPVERHELMAWMKDKFGEMRAI